MLTWIPQYPFEGFDKTEENVIFYQTKWFIESICIRLVIVITVLKKTPPNLSLKSAYLHGKILVSNIYQRENVLALKYEEYVPTLPTSWDVPTSTLSRNNAHKNLVYAETLLLGGYLIYIVTSEKF